jgi:hypothetical protein
LHQANIGPDGQPVDPWPTDDPFDILTSPFPRRFPSQDGNDDDDEGDTGQPAKRPTLPDTTGPGGPEPGGPEPGGPELDPSSLAPLDLTEDRHFDRVVELERVLEQFFDLPITDEGVVNVNVQGDWGDAKELFRLLGPRNILPRNAPEGQLNYTGEYVEGINLNLRSYSNPNTTGRSEITVGINGYGRTRKIVFRFLDDPSLPVLEVLQPPQP